MKLRRYLRFEPVKNLTWGNARVQHSHSLTGPWTLVPKRKAMFLPQLLWQQGTGKEDVLDTNGHVITKEGLVEIVRRSRAFRRSAQQTIFFGSVGTNPERFTGLSAYLCPRKRGKAKGVVVSALGRAAGAIIERVGLPSPKWRWFDTDLRRSIDSAHREALRELFDPI